MQIMTYIFIFISKIIENALATLRLIVVAGGKKWFGAILQFCISLIWILVTGAVIVNLNKDPLKILFFCFGTFVGSIIGSKLEERIALGDNLITCITDNDNHILDNTLNRKGYNLTKIKGEINNSPKDILLIATPRKKKKYIVSIIKNIDSKATILSESVKLTK